MSRINRGEKLQRRAQFELCEPRQLMTAQPGTTPDFQVDYYLGGPVGAGDVATQATATTLSAEGYYQTAIDQIRAQYGFTGAGQTVVTIDTGIAYDDAALGGGFGSGFRVVGGWDFAENDADPYDDGPAGSHGTHVAGIIGSSDPDHLGVAPGVDLVSLRVFDDGGSGYFSWIDSALRWVYDHRDSFRSPITTVNLSLGAAWNSAGIPSWANLENDFMMLKQAGIFISVAAGNSFGNYGAAGLSYPAASPYVVPVMSESGDGQLSGFSQRLDRAIAAPGEGIVSSVPDYAGNQNGLDDDWASYSGSSMAAAYMSGAAVIVRQALAQTGRTNVNEDTIYQLMRSTADTIYDSATNASYLALDLKAAVDAALRMPATPVDREGNTPATAVNLGSLDLRSTASGSTDVAGDQDFFHFTAAHTGKVTISITRDAGLKTRWQLVNANGTLRNVTGNSITLQVVAGKTYAFGIQGIGGLGDYDLTMQLAPSFTGLGLVNMRTINNQRVSGEKWYRFQAAHTGTLALASKVPSGAGVTIELYNSAMQKVGTSSGDYTELLSALASCGSLYYVRLSGANAKVQLSLGCGAGAAKVAGLKTASVASLGSGFARGDQESAANSASIATARALLGAADRVATAERSFVSLHTAGGGDNVRVQPVSLRSSASDLDIEELQRDEATATLRSEDDGTPDIRASAEACVDQIFGALEGDFAPAIA